MKNFLAIRDTAREELETLMEMAGAYRQALDARLVSEAVMHNLTVANLFFEPSTRTRLSFATAASRLGAHTLDFFPEESSLGKGESIRDTAQTVAAIGLGVMVVRHAETGIPARVAEWTDLPTINAGDGTGEHPTQALLDCLTIHQRFGRTEGLRVVVTGDIAHSRVAGSLVPALECLGASVVMAAPKVWLPDWGSRADIVDTLDDAIEDADVVYCLRVQKERGGVIDDDYVANFQLDARRASALSPSAVVMHPGPMNRGVEITGEVADSSRSLVLEQVRNGVPARMAVLAMVSRYIP